MGREKLHRARSGYMNVATNNYKYVICIKSQFSLSSIKVFTNERRPHRESNNQMSEGDQSMCLYAPKCD